MIVGSVAVVGAGLAGLACARVLHAARVPVVVYEKSRGLGGRLATRRAGALSFDHGAQYFTARDVKFRDYVDLALSAGYVAPWTPGIAGVRPDDPWYVGTPGMSAFVRPLAAGLDVRCRVRITAAIHRRDGWWLTTESGDSLGPYRAVALAIPAPQVSALIANLAWETEIAAHLAHVRMTSCWTVMAAFNTPAAADFEVRVREGGPLSWMTRNSSKPARSTTVDCWVLQADPLWSAKHQDAATADVTVDLMRAARADLGAFPALRYSTAHRWLHARVERPLGEPFVFHPDKHLGLCGDWCLAPRVEAAWVSGTRLGEAMREVL